jgi:hypothetical protein
MSKDKQQAQMFLDEVARRKDSDYADIHSCSYSCQRPGCISRQRDELRGYAMAIYDAVRDVYPSHRLSFKEVMEFAATKLKEKM